MKRWNYNHRYFVTNYDGIPFHAQPTEGYTYLQAVARVQREIKEDVQLFGGQFSDYVKWYFIVDDKFRTVKDCQLDF